MFTWRKVVQQMENIEKVDPVQKNYKKDGNNGHDEFLLV